MRELHPPWLLLAPTMKLLFLGGLIFALDIWGTSALLDIVNLLNCRDLLQAQLSPFSHVYDVRGLPWTVNISERLGPGSVIHVFSFNCSCPPTLEIDRVTPSSTFFNQPDLSGFSTRYMAKVTLSSSARLDARQVNHYQLNLKLTCMKEIRNFPLSVEVFRAHGPPVCLDRFASAAGDRVQVLETVKPRSLIYTVLLRRELAGVKMTIISPQDPLDFPGSFSIDERGRVLTPSQSLIGSAYKNFPLRILVTNRQGESCHGTLTVEVLPDPSSKVSFGIQFQTFNISEDLVAGGTVGQVRANGSSVRYAIIEPVPCPLYSISPVDGTIRTTTPLDLGRNPGAAVTKLQVKAYDPFQPWTNDLLSVIINVQPTNTWAPRCTPALLVTHVPETIPVGTILMTLACSDPDSSSSTFHYQLWHHNETKPDHSFRLRGPVLQVNNTLDYDSSAPNVQYRTTILVTDSGQPPQTSQVPVLVTVTPVNEYPPVCPAHTFLVREDAPPGKLVGTVLGSDRDYPPNSIEYHISDSSSNFYIDPHSGKIHLLASLDYEKQRIHMLVIFLTDRDQDQDPTHRKSGSCTITIEVQNVNDHAPECEPPFQELTISSGPSISAEVTRLTCSDRDVPEQAPEAFSFSIVGGNSNRRFSMKDNILLHNVFSFQPDGLLDPLTYELLVRVTDKGPTFPLFSTTAIVIVHVIPWTTTVPTTSTKAETISSPTPLLVTLIEDYWAPEPWFVVVLTVTGILLFTVLGWLLCRCPGRMAHNLQTPGQSSQTLLLNSTKRDENSADELIKKNDEARSILSLQQFDGRAQDPAAQENGAGSETPLHSMGKSYFKKLGAVFFWKWLRYIKGIQCDSFPCWFHTLLTPFFYPAPPFLLSYHLRP
ncbi:cadherin-related family member 4 isoform X1 [Monodelphis domestica]|uniref:cadherin-related family member 4 isoform X1 n=1 Tax=Monodelphis domestica TaxID=13616 RepID=UPI0024E232F8|nr:cadherin-related family member 4 isoform X1 [Monodelphis domestica]